MTKTLEDVVGMKVNKQLRKGVVKRTGVIQEVPEGEQVDYVTCSYCQARHLYESSTYVELVGNLHSGEGGGLLGNPDWKEHGVPASYYCVDKHCLSKHVQKCEHEVIDSNNNVYLREGETLDIVYGVETEKRLILSGTVVHILERKHDVITLDVPRGLPLDSVTVSVPRETIRQWFKDDKVKRSSSKRP
jgi:hypothetical protein